MRRYQILAGLVCLALAYPGLARAEDRGGKQPVYKTPEEAFKAAQMASAKGDWKTMAAILAPETQEFLTAYFIVMSAAATDVVEGPPNEAVFEKLKAKKQDLSKVLVKHGLTEEVLKKMAADKILPDLKGKPDPQTKMDKIAAPVKDRVGFIGDVAAILIPALGDGPGKSKDPFANKVLKDVKIDGDKATGKTVNVIDGQEKGSQDIQFQRINDSWRIIMPMGGKATKPPTKPAEKQ